MAFTNAMVRMVIVSVWKMVAADRLSVAMVMNNSEPTILFECLTTTCRSTYGTRFKINPTSLDCPESLKADSAWAGAVEKTHVASSHSISRSNRSCPIVTEGMPFLDGPAASFDDPISLVPQIQNFDKTGRLLATEPLVDIIHTTTGIGLGKLLLTWRKN